MSLFSDLEALHLTPITLDVCVGINHIICICFHRGTVTDPSAASILQHDLDI